MRLSNKTYDFLKWFALVALPATQVLWLTVGKVWNFPYLTEIGATIGAIGLFIAALLGVSSAHYTEELTDEEAATMIAEMEDDDNE